MLPLGSGLIMGALLGEFIAPLLTLVPLFCMWALLLCLLFLRGGAVFFITLALACAGVALGLARVASLVPNQDSLLVLGEPVTLRGAIVREPDQREAATQLTLREERSGTLILVRLTGGEYRYGDQLTLRGTLAVPEAFLTSAGVSFDYPNYLRARGISLLLTNAKVIMREEQRRTTPLGTLFALKRSFLIALARVIPEPHTSLAAGLILGERRSLGEELSEQFRRAGLSHILVASGYNLSVIAAALFSLSSLHLSRKQGAALVSLALISFVALTGFDAPVLRAALMALLLITARLAGRAVAPSTLLLYALAALALYRPALLAQDLGTQLSFLATAGLLFIAPLIVRHLSWVPERFGIREVLGSSAAALIAVTPLLLLRVGTASVVALPANLLVLPLVPLAMLGSTVSAALALIAVPLAFPFAFATTLILSWVVFVARSFGSLAIAELSFHAPLLLVLLSYALLIACVHRAHMRQPV